MEKNIDEAETLKNLGNDAFKNNQFQEAINHYTEALCKFYPPDGKLISWIAKCESEVFFSNWAASYMALGRFQEAYYDLKKSLDINSKYAKSARWLFTVCLWLGHVQEAKGVLELYMKEIPEEKGFKDDIWTLTEV